MEVEVDQSGKIEDTSKDTALAFSNKLNSGIKIKARVKRKLQRLFRTRGQPRLFIYRTFAAAVVILIRGSLREITTIIIDQEYPGKEAVIKEYILEFLKRSNLKLPQINFSQIGKKSAAHDIGYLVFKGKRKPDKVINFEELAAILNKKRPRSQKGLKNA